MTLNDRHSLVQADNSSYIKVLIKILSYLPFNSNKGENKYIYIISTHLIFSVYTNCKHFSPYVLAATQIFLPNML